MTKNNYDSVYVDGKPKQRVVDASCLNPFYERKNFKIGIYLGKSTRGNAEVPKISTRFLPEDFCTD